MYQQSRPIPLLRRYTVVPEAIIDHAHVDTPHQQQYPTTVPLPPSLMAKIPKEKRPPRPPPPFPENTDRGRWVRAKYPEVEPHFGKGKDAAKPYVETVVLAQYSERFNLPGLSKHSETAKVRVDAIALKYPLTVTCQQLYAFFKNKHGDVIRPKRASKRDDKAPQVVSVGVDHPKGKHRFGGFALFVQDFRDEIRESVAAMEGIGNDIGLWKTIASIKWGQLSQAERDEYKAAAEAAEAARPKVEETTAENFNE